MANNDLSRPHVFLPGSDRTLLLLHGTGGDENDLIRLGKALDPEATLLSPRGMYLEAGMNRFFERYSDGSFNEDSISEAVEELVGFLEAAAQQYQLDRSKICAAGFSNGANTAAALMVTHPNWLAQAVLFGSTRPFVEFRGEPDLSGKQIWIANGDFDPYAPNQVTEEWVAQLRGFGADVAWLRHPGGHQISPAHLQEISSSLN
jgi:phospholipase/carboxylesterase